MCIRDRFRTRAVNVRGALPDGVTAKDVVLAVIAQIGTGGGQGYVIEYRGEAIESLSMEARMTICNMSIEAGARAGMIAPDEVTFDYLEGRDRAPKGADWDAAVAAWRQLRTDDDAVFDAAVSYTHLDVYKRQGIPHGVWCNWQHVGFWFRNSRFESWYPSSGRPQARLGRQHHRLGGTAAGR